MTAHERTDSLIKRLEWEINRIYAASEAGIVEKVRVYLETLEPKIVDLVKKHEAGKLSDQQYRSSITVLLTSSREYPRLSGEIADDVTDVSERAYEAFHSFSQKIYSETYNEEFQEAKRDFSEFFASFVPLLALSVKDMFPGDQSGGATPGLIYNCRCYMKRER